MPNKQMRLTEEEIALIKAVRQKQINITHLTEVINSLNDIKQQKQKVNPKVIKWNIPDKKGE